MPPTFPSAQGLSFILGAVLNGSQTRKQVNDLVAVCHGLASTVLRRKIAATSLQGRFHYSSYRDLAYDCIADLFRQNENGVLEVLRKYFAGVNLEELDEAEILIHCRRLVTARVNQEIFRIYGEIDPSLAKVLRNLKVALTDLHSFTLITRFGESFLVPSVIDPKESMPTLETKALESELSGVMGRDYDVPAMLSALSKFLREQTSYCRVVPLMTVALAFRSIITRQGEIRDTVEMEEDFTSLDIAKIISQSCSTVRNEMEAKYINSKKMDKDLFCRYFAVIEQVMALRFTGDGAEEITLFETLKSVDPNVTHEEYYRQHRSILEYIARVTHRHIADRLRADLSLGR